MTFKNLKPGKWLLTGAVATLASLTFSLTPVSVLGQGPSLGPPVNIDPTPLTVVIPAHPQVIVAVANSNSMDSSDDVTDDANADLVSNAPSSAIMTWSGQTGGSGLSASTSPANYQVPVGFTAPITGATSGSAPYTAALEPYTVTNNSPGSGAWGCAIPWTTTPTTLTQPDNPPNGSQTGQPAPSNFPGSLIWNPYVTWYYNGTYSTSLLPQAAIHVIPSAREKFHGLAPELAMSTAAGLRPVGMGNGSPVQVITNSSGKLPPTQPPQCGPGSNPYKPCCGPGSDPYVACQAPQQTYCHLWKWTWTAASTSTHTYSYYGDNSPSRLNIAKASISEIIKTYANSADFGLMSYSVSGISANQTWAYYMSPPNGFVFSNTYAAPSATQQWVNNPCYQASGDVTGACGLVSTAIGNPTGPIKNYQYMAVAARSDDPLIDDIFLVNNASFSDPVFMAYNVPAAASTSAPPPTGQPVSVPPLPPSPATPYPPNFSVSDYNAGNVSLTYNATAPVIGPGSTLPGTVYTVPTNAGFVAASPEVLYARRGYLWQGTPTDNTGTVLQPIISMSNPTSAPTPTSGQTQAEADLAAYTAQFQPFLEPENNVPSSAGAMYTKYGSAIFASASQSPTAGLLQGALTTYQNMGAPAVINGCVTPRYVILMTDGLPTEDMQGNSWPPPGSSAATGYNVVTLFNSDGSLDTSASDLANQPEVNGVPAVYNQAVIDTINRLTALRQAGIKTFVVGLGAGANPSLNLNPIAIKTLNAMAIAGGTGSYYPGPNATAVTNALTGILNLITSVNVSSVSGAFNTTSLNENTRLYQASYTGFDETHNPAFNDWTGNLKAFAANTNYPSHSTAVPPAYGSIDTTGTPIWDAQTELDSLVSGNGWDDNRNIITCRPDHYDRCDNGSGVPFRWGHGYGSSPNGIDHTQKVELGTPQTGPEVLDYLRGDTALEQQNNGPYRNRSHILGDIVDSAPLYIGAPNGPYLNDVTYQQFVSAQASRTGTIYVGANDGMLHAFNATTGKEDFAFIPNGVFKNLARLTDPGYNNDTSRHQYFVDGSPSAGDVKFSGGCGSTGSCWHTVLVGGLDDGGNSIYALDITDPSSFTSEGSAKQDVLWEFTNPDLGLTYSQPVIALTSDKSSLNANPNGFLVFFGSGYNNTNNGSNSGDDYLFAVNPQTGNLVAKIDLCDADRSACSTAIPNGLSGVTVINSTGAISQPADTIYAGDLQGNLWKINIASANPSDWTVTLLFKATDSQGNPQPITETPVVSLAPSASLGGTMVFFGTGEYLGQPDLTNMNTQSFYGIWDNGSTATRAELQSQTLSTVSYMPPNSDQVVSIRTVSTNSVTLDSTHRGWYMDLPAQGERSITDPRLYNGEVIFTTFIPAAQNTCTGGGQSFLMVVNYTNGSSFPQPAISVAGDNTLTATADGKDPVGIAIGPMASAPSVLMTKRGPMKYGTLAGPAYGGNSPYSGKGNEAHVMDAPGSSGQLSWFQIR